MILDNEEIHFYLQFGDAEKVEIAEPIGFDGAMFNTETDKGRYGRDVTFAFGDSELEFSPNVYFRNLDHRFNQLISEYQTNGFESDVKFIMSTQQKEYVIGSLDFFYAETDLYNYFRCKVIQDTAQATIKRREDVKVDVFNDEDLDGNYIEPLKATDIFLRASPETQSSKWTLFSASGYTINDPILFDIDYFFNLFPQIDKSDIEDTLSPIQNTSASNLTDFAIVRAQNELSNVTLKISDLDYSFTFDPLNSFPEANGGFYYWIGLEEEYQFGDATPIFQTGFLTENNPSYTITNGEFIIENLRIERGQILILFFQTAANANNQSYTLSNVVSDGYVEVTAISRSISSVIKSFRLIDVVKQVTKSISGMEVVAPRFDVGGELYDQYITNGLLIRGITDQPFNVSYKDILEYLPEPNADYQIEDDNNIFIGFYEDFFQDVNMGSFPMAPNEVFSTYFNDEFGINTVAFKYKKYEKSNDEQGSRDSVHTSLQLLLPNLRVENEKKIDIGFIRDSFLLESTRKDAIIVTEDTATENDEDIFILDVIEKNIQQNETLVLRHQMVDNTTLKIANDGTFNWELLGIRINDFITIGLANAGTWLVGDITPTVITLLATGSAQATENGLLLTNIIYNITSTDLTNRTDEGFDYISNTSNPDGFSNLFFTPKRVLTKYWGNYLLTCCEYRQTKEIKITEYIHNRELISKKADEQDQVKEGDPIDLGDLAVNGLAILSPYEVQTSIICDFDTYWNLQESTKTLRGYIEVMGNNGVSNKIHPLKLEYDLQRNLLNITGKVRK